jgi:ribosomal protein L18
MTESLYRIAPLQWELPYPEYWRCEVINGVYRVDINRTTTGITCQAIHADNQESDIVVDGRTHDNADSAKAACQSHWNQTLSQYLEKVK